MANLSKLCKARDRSANVWTMPAEKQG